MNARDEDIPPAPATAAPEGIEAVYRREAPRLARFFRRHVPVRHEIPDLVQEAFARLIGVQGASAPARPSAYLQRIARNLLYDRSRRTDVKLARFHFPIDATPDIAVAPEQEQAIGADDIMQAYRRAVAGLPEKTRQAFLLHRVEGLGYREIGEHLGISVPTVQYHVARALMIIEKALDGE
jgi:RNA polymerase sigma-70 factor (ECF subfamily)